VGAGLGRGEIPVFILSWRKRLWAVRRPRKGILGRFLGAHLLRRRRGAKQTRAILGWTAVVVWQGCAVTHLLFPLRSPPGENNVRGHGRDRYFLVSLKIGLGVFRSEETNPGPHPHRPPWTRRSDRGPQSVNATGRSTLGFASIRIRSGAPSMRAHKYLPESRADRDTGRGFFPRDCSVRGGPQWPAGVGQAKGWFPGAEEKKTPHLAGPRGRGPREGPPFGARETRRGARV